MKLQFDFVAPADKTFGVIAPIDELIDAIPSAIDVWNAAPDRVTLAAGKVSAWTGRKNSRVLSQATVARQPVLEGNRIRFSSDAGAAAASLSLDGAAIGVRTALTIAVHVSILPAALDTDLHYIYGHNTPISRLAYRFTNGTRYLRMQVGSQNLDAALPADWSGTVGAVLVLSGSSLSLHLSTGVSSTITLTSGFELASFTVGNAQLNVAGDLPGSIGNLGIWGKTATEAERNLMLRWVG